MQYPGDTIRFLGYGYSKYIEKTLKLPGLTINYQEWTKYENRTPTHLSESRIDYKELRKIYPETARTAVEEYLKSQLPDIDDKIRFVINIMLDKVSIELGPWSGYHVLVQCH